MSNTLESCRQLSTKNWTGVGTIEQINSGSLQRITDATEKMAFRHTDLIRERDQYQRWYEQEYTHVKLLKRQLAAAKGHITKLKRKATSVIEQVG